MSHRILYPATSRMTKDTMSKKKHKKERKVEKVIEAPITPKPESVILAENGGKVIPPQAASDGPANPPMPTPEEMKQAALAAYEQQVEFENHIFPKLAEWREVFPTLTPEELTPLMKQVDDETDKQWDRWQKAVAPTFFGNILSNMNPELAGSLKITEAMVMAYATVRALVLVEGIELFLAKRNNQVA